MAEKKVNEYTVTFSKIKDSRGEPVTGQRVELLFKNHDDVFKIFALIKEKGLFDHQADAEQFVLGLKLFGDVMMRNKDMELFSEMQPAFIAFMKKLKEKN